MKTLLLTAAMAVSAFAFGYYGPDAATSVGSQVKAEFAAVVNHFRYDPERSARKCLSEAYDLSYCVTHTKAWMKRDGQDVVIPVITRTLLTRGLTGDKFKLPTKDM